jgi:hypothetical protein
LVCFNPAQGLGPRLGPFLCSVQIYSQDQLVGAEIWRTRRDSNSRPLPSEAAVLAAIVCDLNVEIEPQEDLLRYLSLLEILKSQIVVSLFARVPGFTAMLTILLPITTICVAIAGFYVWHRQLIRTRQFEVADAALLYSIARKLP